MATTTEIPNMPGQNITEFKVLSWNVGGLNTPIKRKKVLDRLRREKAQVILLQETHWCRKDKQTLKDKWLQIVQEASYKTKTRGVAILISKDLPCTLSKTYKDKNGRYILADLEIYGIKYTIVNIYAPNNENKCFFTGVLQKVDSWGTTNIILGGDMNVTWDDFMDKSGKTTAHSKNRARPLHNLCDILQLHDTYRYLHPIAKDYTFYSGVHKSHSRLDYIFVSRALLPAVSTATIGNIDISDHAQISIKLKL
uniref:exodeoxyribonuclease III n=1 Tax=Xenopus tropicalis TaxID=8364 RepID=A0A803KAJ7_XENTR